jgi:beta-xylosidase
MVVFHSTDLVNWEIIGHVISDISTLGKELNWDSMSAYNQGVYAGSLRFHNNKYYCHFTTRNSGWYVATSDRAEGPWKVSQMKDMEGHALNGYGWDDNCPLWDDNGNAYIIASNFGKYEWCPRIFKMNSDGTQILDGRISENSINSDYLDITGGYITHPYRTSEANKIFKHNNFYYFFFSEVRNSDGFKLRIPVILRSKNIYGPYELKELLHTQGTEKDYEPNQGSIVDTPDGKDWYFVTHHGTGHFSGRFLSVLSMKWVNDWPVIGVDNDNDGVGEMVWEQKMPNLSNSKIKMQSNDYFTSPVLGVQWQWNHQPRADKWSLTEHPGFLRLHAFKPVQKNDFFKSGNTIGQRYYRCENSKATVKIEITGMENGQDAGLCQYDGGKNYSSLGLVMIDGIKKLMYKQKEDNKPLIISIGIVLPMKVNEIFFRLNADFQGKCSFQYSIDGKKFIAYGETSQLTWGNYRGTRLGIYTCNDLQEAGFVDVDWFEYQLVNN